MKLLIREINENDPWTISAAFKEQGWDKPVALYERYVAEQKNGDRATLLAEIDGVFTGYVNVIWNSRYPVFRENSIPEISDFNVLAKYQRSGIGNRLMDRAEALIGERSSVAGIGVGIFSDYGDAQRLYVKRGYMPDGKGIYNGRSYVKYGDQIVIDDDIALYFTKRLSEASSPQAMASNAPETTGALTGIIYRDANHSDLPRIVEIYNSTIPSRMVTADVENVSVASRLQWFDEHDPSKRPLWVIEDSAKQIIGWVSFQSFYGRPAYDATAEISIYLDGEQRGKGLGKQALRYCIEHAPRLGINTLLGFIFSHNEPSLKLFRYFGFEDWATLPNIALLDGQERSLKILGKRVG
ncbi:MAG: GNAT family N-acetyltransferase [Chitinophagaceae bacterium]|nr:GNAT family N-acetyltransferase [Chitinophagaceae bacterium]